MSRRSRSTASSLEDTTFFGRVLKVDSVKKDRIRNVVTILMKNDWKFEADTRNFIDQCFAKSVRLDDIVQFRLMDVDNVKIPIMIDEATAYQRESYLGNDSTVARSVGNKGILTESKENNKVEPVIRTENDKLEKIVRKKRPENQENIPQQPPEEKTVKLKKLKKPRASSASSQVSKTSTNSSKSAQQLTSPDASYNVDSVSSISADRVKVNESNEVNKYEWGKTKLLSRDHKVFYDTLRIIGNDETIEIKTGSHIIIENQDDRRKPFVARVARFFEDTKLETDKKRVIVEWYLRLSDCNQFRKTDREAEKDEVFLYSGNSIPKNIDAETIIWKCQVFDFSHRNKLHPNPKQNLKFFYCRAFFDGKKGFHDLDARQLTKMDKPAPGLRSPVKSPKKISTKTLLDQMSQSSSEEESEASSVDDRFSEKSSEEVIPISSRTRKSSSESSSTVPVRRSRRISSETETAISKTKSSRRSLFTENTPSKPTSTRPTRSKRKQSSESVSSVEDTPSKVLASKLKSGLNIQTPVKKSNRRKTTALTTIKETPKRTSKRTQNPELTLTPRSKLAKEIDDLSLRRSKRHSAAQANFNIMDTGGYQPSDEENSTTDDDDSSGDATSDDEEILKTPKKRARPWRGAKTPTKTPKKSAKHAPKTPSKKGNAPQMFEQKSAPKRVVLPDFITQSNDLMKILGQASTRLDINSVPDSLPCRESEYQNIFNFIEDKLNHNTGGCLYISGVPGTGKTATTQEAIAALRKEVEEDNLPKFKYIELNGMRMTRPKQAYAAIWSQLTGEKRTADHASELLEEKFESRRMKEPILMLVDELDQLMTRKQDVLYRMFDWPQRSKVIVLAIANTFDLPERVMQRRVQSRLGLSRETFSPYTFGQLEEIIKSRLGKNLSRLFEESGIAFIARKVASLSGDARRALEICRQAVEQSMIRYESTNDPSSVYIRLKDVIQAVNTISCNPAILLMKTAPLYAKVFLRATVAAFRSSGIEEATIEEIIQHIDAIAHIDGLKELQWHETIPIANWLETSGFILVDNLTIGIYAKVRLNISPEDILFALNKE